jgi:two-component system, NtrC family, response regulator AtoC
MKPIKVLVIEEADGRRDYLSELLNIIGYQADCLCEKRQFLTKFHQYDPDVVVLGPSNHPGQTRAFADVVVREKARTPILVVTQDQSAYEGEQESCAGSVAYLSEGFDSRDFKQTMEQLIRESRDNVPGIMHDKIVGETPAMLKLKRNIVRIAATDSTVLLNGESGTGKELVARAIHESSPRSDKPFVKVNSAALPSNLLESELFGYERGAFTGAFNKKLGKFELANSGTIFLDEIGEIPLHMQAKLLQVLQDNEFSALGSTSNTRIDSRVLAATNHNLGQMVTDGLFRPDLYYRLNVVSISIPPLRDRKKDIGLLCETFLRRYATQHNKPHMPLADKTYRQLYEYSWPGNVRELENFVQTVTVLGDKGQLCKRMGNHPLNDAFLTAAENFHENGDSPAPNPIPRSLKKASKKAVQLAETEAIMDVLFHTRWNRKKAADLLQISYKGLLSKIKEYGIDKQYGEFVKKDMHPDAPTPKISP